MVKEVKDKEKMLYICEAYGFTYKEREWAEKCQSWCEQNHSCNLEITQYATAMKFKD